MQSWRSSAHVVRHPRDRADNASKPKAYGLRSCDILVIFILVTCGALLHCLSIIPLTTFIPAVFSPGPFRATHPGSESRWRPIDPFAASCCYNPCARGWLPLGRSLLVLTTLYWLRSQLSSTCISLVRHPRFDPDALDSRTGHAC